MAHAQCYAHLGKHWSESKWVIRSPHNKIYLAVEHFWGFFTQANKQPFCLRHCTGKEVENSFVRCVIPCLWEGSISYLCCKNWVCYRSLFLSINDGGEAALATVPYLWWHSVLVTSPPANFGTIVLAQAAFALFSLPLSLSLWQELFKGSSDEETGRV